MHSNSIFSLHYNPSREPETIFQEHLLWAAENIPAINFVCSNEPSAFRRLRLGYVSADFREHAATRFLQPLLRHHDHKAFEIFCYSDVTSSDALTRQFRQCADNWRETAAHSDDDLAQLICQDRIDILIEMTGHMAGNRLLVFARKPAPIQITYPGYPNTTGLSTIDYCLTDADRDPPGSEVFYTETLIRIPITAQAYDPGPDIPNVGVLPVRSAGLITFASFNQPIKINDPVIAVWSQILHTVAQSQLLLLADFEARQDLMRRFAQHGVDFERLRLVPPRPRRQYLELHNQADIILDTWPYNGHTTTLDGLYMGVPPICLEGKTHVSREGLALCRLLGLDDLVATTTDDYIKIAVRLANDLPRLQSLRTTLRQKIQRSPLMDGPGLTRRIEAVYRQVWQRWCDQKSAESP